MCLDNQRSTKFKHTIARDCHGKKDDIFPKTKKDLVVLTRQCLLRYSRFKELIWEKTRQPDFGYHWHCLKSSFGHTRKSNQFEMYSKFTIEVVSVIAKVRLPRFFSYQFFKNANIGVNTAASIQPNPFWFWEKYHPFFRTLVQDGFGDS